MTVTAELCRRIAATRPADIGDAALSAARMLLMDGLAVAVAGARTEPVVDILAGHLLDQGSRPVATALGLGIRLGTVSAALLNGVSMHVLDFEPMWLPSTHALSPVLSALLPLAEERGASGLDVLTALVLGIEIQGWIRQASGHVPSGEHRFHPPGVVGPLGAAVAASHLIGLDAGQIANALGIASSRCGGLFANVGTMTKSTHCGYAAALGLESALLAERGFTGNGKLFEADQGFVGAFLPPSFDPTMLLRFGPPWRIVEPGCAIKIFPAKFTTHYGITAALAARAEIPDASAIVAVKMLSAAVPSADRPMPATGLEGKFSMQYTVAAALLDGRVGLDSFTDARLRSPDMQALLPKIALTMSPTITTLYNAGRYVELTVTLDDGRVVATRCDRPRGSWGSTPISPEEHDTKVRDCLATGLSPDAIDAAVAIGNTLDRQDAAGVRELLRLAGGLTQAGVVY
jgi:aconitate decarboxylase